MLQPSASAATALVVFALAGSSFAARASPPVGSVVKSPSTDELRTSSNLAPGTYFTSGSINANIVWQASGVLSAGGCGRPNGVDIQSCYEMSLTAQGQLESTVKVGKRGLGNLTLEETAIKNPDDLNAYFAAFPEQQPFRNLAGALDVRKRNATRMHQRRQLLNPKLVVGLGLGVLNPKLGEITINIPILPSLLSELLPTPTTSLPSATVLPTLTSVVASVVSSLVPTITVSSAPVPTGTALTGRQRNEMYSWPGALAGEKWNYSWKTWTRPGVSTSAHFSHAWQMLRRDKTGGPVIALDYKVEKVVISDLIKGCKACVVAPLASWVGIVVIHTLDVTWGPSGSMTYNAADVRYPNVPLISYSAKHDMGSSASIKFGMYRMVIPTATDMQGYVGDYVGTRLA